MGNLKFIFSCKIVSTQVCFLTSSTEESSTFSSLKRDSENHCEILESGPFY